MINTERDAQIVQRYRSGETQQALAEAYSLTRGRIVQILKKEGISFNDSPRKPRNLYGFVGANITKSMKAKLQAESKRTGKSMSRLLEEALDTRLIAGDAPHADSEPAKS